MQHNSMDLLDPVFRSKLEKMIKQMEADPELLEAGFKTVLIGETLREMSHQLVRWLQGKMKKAEDVQEAYMTVLGWSPSLKNCADKEVSWTLKSKHLTGKAADMYPSKDGKTKWFPPREVLERMGHIAKLNGITCGIEWWNADPRKNRDDPYHYEDKE